MLYKNEFLSSCVVNKYKQNIVTSFQLKSKDCINPRHISQSIADTEPRLNDIVAYSNIASLDYVPRLVEEIRV